MKNKSGRLLVLILMAVSITACNNAGSSGLSDHDREAIQKMSVEGVKLFNSPSKDFATAVKFYYTEDAITLPPNEPAVQGRADQIAWYKAYPPFELAEKIVELDGRGDLAYARLTYTLKIMMPGATEPVIDHGKGLEIWKKQSDGVWKCSCDVFNSDLPMRAPGERIQK